MSCVIVTDQQDNKCKLFCVAVTHTYQHTLYHSPPPQHYKDTMSFLPGAICSVCISCALGLSMALLWPLPFLVLSLFDLFADPVFNACHPAVLRSCRPSILPSWPKLSIIQRLHVTHAYVAAYFSFLRMSPKDAGSCLGSLVVCINN